LAKYFIKTMQINLKTLKKFNFIDHIIVISFITAIFYYIGGTLWVGAIFYVFIILYTSFLSNLKEVIVITSIAFISYSLIVLLEYFNLIPYKGLFKLNPLLYQDSQYIIATILLIGVTFALIFIIGRNFAQILKEKNERINSK